MPNDDQKFLELTDQITQRAQLRAEGIGIPQICAEWQTLKPLVMSLLTLIERIPVIGAKIGAVVRKLVALLDMVCMIPAR